MSDPNLQLALVVKAVDQATATLGKVQTSMAGVHRTMKDVSTASRAPMAPVAQFGAGVVVGNLFTEVLNHVGAAMSAVIQESIDLDVALMRVVNTGEMGVGAFKDIRKELTDLSAAVGVSRGELVTSLNRFVEAGLEPKKAMSFLPMVAKAHATYGGNILDFTKAVETGARQFDMADPSQILETLIRAGKQGNVEVSSLAKFLPELGGAYKAANYGGRAGLASLAASLEAVMKVSASPEEAATAIRNLLGHLPTLQKSFVAAGLFDPQAMWNKSVAEGRDPLSAIARSLKASGFDSMEKLAKIMPEMRERKAMLGIMQNLEFYEDTLKKSLGASGQLSKDSANIEKTLGFQIQKFRANFVKIADEILAPKLALLNRLMTFLNEHTGLVRAGMKGLMLLVTGGPLVYGFMKLAGFAGTLFRVFGIMGHFGAFSGLGRILLAGGSPLMGSLVSAIPALLPALGPIALYMGAIAAAGFLLYRAFKPFIDGFARGFWDGLKADLPEILDLFGQVGDAVGELGAQIGNLAGELFGGGAAWGDYASGMELGLDVAKAMNQQIKNAVSALVILIGGIGDMVFAFKQSLQEMLHPLAVFAEMLSVLKGGGSWTQAKEAGARLGDEMNRQRKEDANAQAEKRDNRYTKAMKGAGYLAPEPGDPNFNGPVQPGVRGRSGKDLAAEMTKAMAASNEKVPAAQLGDIMPITVNVSGGGADAKTIADQVVAAVRARARDLVPILEQAGLVLDRKKA